LALLIVEGKVKDGHEVKVDEKDGLITVK
jgi:hypothetical protein